MATSRTYTFTNVTADHTISATFSAIPTYTASFVTSPAGIASIPSVTCQRGDTVVLWAQGNTLRFAGSISNTVTPPTVTGYTFSKWQIDGTDMVAQQTYTINANTTFTCVYTTTQYTITATAGNNGSITPSGSVSVNHGADQTFTIEADAGYEIASVSVDGTPI